MEFEKLSDKKEWKELIKNSSNNYEIIIYKHSPICGLSHSIDIVLDDWCKVHSDNNRIKILKVNVVFSKSLSRRIAKDLKVVHESPQIIWLDNELKVKFHASHYDINEEELNKYL
jgi:bacillithiol system protein YtxJ